MHRGLVAIAAMLAVGASEAAAAVDLDAKAVRQIAKLQQFKRSLSGAERKLDSRLAVRLSRDAASRAITEVDVQATAVNDDLLDRLKQAGAVVDYASRRVDSVRARSRLRRSTRSPRGRTSSGSTPPSAPLLPSCPRATRRTPPTSPAPPTASRASA